MREQVGNVTTRMKCHREEHARRQRGIHTNSTQGWFGVHGIRGGLVYMELEVIHRE